MTIVSFEDLLERVRSRDDVVGLCVFGSRGRDFMVDERSDWDVDWLRGNGDYRASGSA